ncbi:NAD(P)-binding protein [Wilcoxina mikolae CBS 423.85]|nr:NAD(P)-binding protein [Wilcoxina mikolae CBS 423.85]
MSQPLVWLITGSTSGFGAAITKAALARGDKVIATARNPSKPEMSSLVSLGASPLALDITGSDSTITSAITSAISLHGRIDILLNNAAYILEGAIEEASHEEVLAQFNTNVFGQLAMVRAVLPYMRAQRSGVVAFMGSMGGWGGMVNGGLYCSTKFTIAGIAEALKLETKHLGIDVTCIEPGYFRTSFLSGGHRVQVGKRIGDLDEVTEGVRKAFDRVDRNQPGDPEKGARVIVEALTKSGRCEGRGELPTRLLVGSDAVEYVEKALEKGRRELEEWRELSETTDCDDVVKGQR